MIGLFGIVSHESVVQKERRFAAFSRMKNDIERDEDFTTESLTCPHFSIGLTKRGIGENKDLAMKAISNSFLCAFCGYGKFKGEKKLYWATEMIDRVAEVFVDKGEAALTLIEGSFQLFLLQGTEFLIVADRFSSKNLFYHSDDKCFVFAPDVGRVVQSGLVPRTKDLDAAKQVLNCGLFLDDSTLVKSVKRSPYGTLLKGRIAPKLEIKTRRYWEIPKNEGTVVVVTPSLVNEFRSKLKQAIDETSELQPSAIVSLSGGLDSRAIAYFLSKRQPLVTVTYDLGDEGGIPGKVCEALGGRQIYFSNQMIRSESFREALKRIIENQRVHAVLNQYFHAPLFSHFFHSNKDREYSAIYDGIYMDILFSAAYVHFSFNVDDFKRIYAGNFEVASLPFCRRLGRDELGSLINTVYEKNIDSLAGSDGVGRSQKAYLNGRLRRYVLECPLAKENYAYVFKPGFDYELADFGFELSLKLRKGLLYRALFKNFSEIKNIPYKDSYGNRPTTLVEKVKQNYRNTRMKISYGTNGLWSYFPWQVEWFFLGLKQIDNYREMLLRPNFIGELFSDDDLEELFESVKKKHYLSGLFQRVLFLQQFYRRYGF